MTNLFFSDRHDVIDPEIEKLCPRCNIVKPLKEFHRHGTGFQLYCKICNSNYGKNWRLKQNNNKIPRRENKTCSQWLGIYIAERVLASTFKNIRVMPENNRAFDFICGKGYKIDVKAACLTHYKNRNDRWSFTIKRNKVADYFLLLAFDDRKSLNPEHVWLVPGGVINDHFGINISVTTVKRWSMYEKSIDKITYCCNHMKLESD